MLEVTDLVCGYGKVPVVGPLSFSVNPHEVVFFIGPNGVGKTTLAKTLATLIPPLQGSIKFNGINMVKARKNILYIPEDVDVPNELRVLDYLKLVAYLYGRSVGRHEVIEALKTIDLLHAQYARLKELSIGQRRRVMLVATLLVKTPVVIIDDPTNYLDEYATEHILPEIIESLSTAGSHVIITTRQQPQYNMQSSRVIDLTSYSYTLRRKST